MNFPIEARNDDCEQYRPAEVSRPDSYREIREAKSAVYAAARAARMREQRAREILGPAVCNQAPAAGFGELRREHSAPVREILRRAGLSMAAELEPAELERARQAVSMFADPRTPAARIRAYIMPAREEELERS